MAVHAEPQRRSRERGAERSSHPTPPAAHHRAPAERVLTPQHDDAGSAWQLPQFREQASRSPDVRSDAAAPGTDGRPLDPRTRAFMEPRFGTRFEHVRIHHDGAAARAASAVDARAFTVGAHIFFAPGQYEPQTPAGRRLLAHELAHVRQHDQARTDHGPATMSTPSDRAEVDARRASAVALAGGRPRISEPVPPHTVCRQENAATEQLGAATTATAAPTTAGASEGQEELVQSVAGTAILADLYTAQVMWPDDRAATGERLTSARAALLDAWSPLMERFVDEFFPMPDEAFAQRFPELSSADHQVQQIATMIDDLVPQVDGDAFDVEASAVIDAQILPALITIEPLLRAIDQGQDVAFQALTAESRSQFTDDLLASVEEAPTHAPGLVDEYLEQHFAQIIMMMYAWLALQGLLWWLGPASVVAYGIQLVMLIAFGIFFAVEAARAYDEATIWLDLVTKANGDPAQISAASKALCRMIGHIGMAILTALGMRRPTAIPASKPTAGGGVRPHRGVPEGSEVIPHPDQPGVDLIVPPQRTTPTPGSTTSAPSSPNLPAPTAGTAVTRFRRTPVIVASGTRSYEARDPATGLVAGSAAIDSVSNFITFTIKVDLPGMQLNGRDVFNMLYLEFVASGAPFNGIVAVWTNARGMDRNLVEFNNAIRAGRGHDQAAWETWTGERCREWGYTRANAEIDPGELNLDGTVEGATVYFTRE